MLDNWTKDEGVEVIEIGSGVLVIMVIFFLGIIAAVMSIWPNISLGMKERFVKILPCCFSIEEDTLGDYSSTHSTASLTSEPGAANDVGSQFQKSNLRAQSQNGPSASSAPYSQRQKPQRQMSAAPSPPSQPSNGIPPPAGGTQGFASHASPLQVKLPPPSSLPRDAPADYNNYVNSPPHQSMQSGRNSAPKTTTASRAYPQVSGNAGQGNRPGHHQHTNNL